MMGYPEGFVTDLLGRNAALKCLGNSVVVQVAELVGSQLVDAASGHPRPAHSDTARVRETSGVASLPNWREASAET